MAVEVLRARGPAGAASAAFSRPSGGLPRGRVPHARACPSISIESEARVLGGARHSSTSVQVGLRREHSCESERVLSFGGIIVHS